jgi:hypothetical protein
MNDKPKDRTTMWMSIIALILVLMSAYFLGVMIYKILTNGYIMQIVVYPFYLVFIAIILQWIMRKKRTYKPKDRTKMMSIIALILVIISGCLVGMICMIVTREDGIGALLCFLCLACLAFALHWKAVGGVFFVILGLLGVYTGVRDIITGSYETLLEQILIYLVWVGLMPLFIGLLFLAIWRKERKAKVPISSD